MLTPGGTEQELSQDTAALRQALEADLRQYPAQSPSGPFLVVLSGLPGTGKSHFARELVKRVPFLILGSDRLRKALLPQPNYTREEHVRVFAACHRLVEDLLREGYRVIFDATNLTEGFRQPLYDIAERLGSPLALVRFTASQVVVRRRLDERAAGLRSDSYSDADWLVYCRLLPGEEPIKRPHFAVDSSQDIYPCLEEVVRLVEGHKV
jgi:predicted kinase